MFHLLDLFLLLKKDTLYPPNTTYIWQLNEPFIV